MPRPQDRIARKIAEDMLEATRQALLDGDCDRFCGMWHVPMQIGSPDGMSTLQTLDDLQRTFHRVRGAYLEQGVTDLDRYCEAVIMKSPDTIEITHISHLVVDGERQEDGYPVFTILKKIDGDWKGVFTDNAVASGSEFARALQLPCSDSEHEVAQTVMREASEAFLTGDFAKWRALVLLPLTTQTLSGTKIISTEAELRHDFDLYQTEFQIHGVTDIIREIKDTRRLSENRLQATYLTRILSGARPIVDPWTSQVTLARTENNWRIVLLERALGHLNWSVPISLQTSSTEPKTPQMGEDE